MKENQYFVRGLEYRGSATVLARSDDPFHVIRIQLDNKGLFDINHMGVKYAGRYFTDRDTFNGASKESTFYVDPLSSEKWGWKAHKLENCSICLEK